MARMPQSYSTNATYGPRFSLPPTPPIRPGPGGREAGKDRTMASLVQLMLDLHNPALRENALLLLSKRKTIFQDLAPLLWNSFGTITILLKEIVSVYPFLSPPTLEFDLSNRVCNALSLLQSVASHSETRIPFLNAHIPLYLYPFLMTTNMTKPYEFLRLTSLGVIGSLVKNDDTEVISFLLQTEIVPLCLRNMENGSELSKTVSTFIFQKIILDEVGLYYICSTPDRFYCVTQVLGTMIESLVRQPSIRLLKHIIRCYLRFSEDRSKNAAAIVKGQLTVFYYRQRGNRTDRSVRCPHRIISPSYMSIFTILVSCRYHACIALRDTLPDSLKDGTFDNLICNDPITILWLQRLLINLYGDVSVGGIQGGFVQ